MSIVKMIRCILALHFISAIRNSIWLIPWLGYFTGQFLILPRLGCTDNDKWCCIYWVLWTFYRGHFPGLENLFSSVSNFMVVLQRNKWELWNFIVRLHYGSISIAPPPRSCPACTMMNFFSKGHQKGPYTFSFVFFEFQAATSAQAEFQHVQDAIDTCRLLYFTVQEFLVLLA